MSEATVYRLLKAHDLITSPAHVMIKAAGHFHTQTTGPNEMWQAAFIYFKMIGGGKYLSDSPRRLLTLHHRLAAMQHVAGRGRH